MPVLFSSITHLLQLVETHVQVLQPQIHVGKCSRLQIVKLGQADVQINLLLGIKAILQRVKHLVKRFHVLAHNFNRTSRTPTIAGRYLSSHGARHSERHYRPYDRRHILYMLFCYLPQISLIYLNPVQCQTIGVNKQRSFCINIYVVLNFHIIFLIITMSMSLKYNTALDVRTNNFLLNYTLR